MKVLLDECVDWRLSRDIVGHEVRATHQMGWSGISNGELLKLAAKQFDVFVTVDRNLSYQQSAVAFDIAIIVLQSTSNRLTDLKMLVPNLLDAIKNMQPGTVRLINQA